MVAKEYLDMLEDVKNKVKNVREVCTKNYQRFDRAKYFLYIDSTIDASRNNSDKDRNRPDLQVNIVNAMICRELGNFAKNMPNIKASSMDDATPVDPKILALVKGRFKKSLYEANNKNFMYDLMRDIICGMGVIKLTTDYQTPYSMQQDIFYSKKDDPTLCYFDLTSKLDDKSDGDFCGEFLPMGLEEFKRLYPQVDTNHITFDGLPSGYADWSFSYGNEKIVYVCYHYYKKYHKQKILELTNGKSINEEDLADYLKEFKEKNIFKVPPEVRSERTTQHFDVCRLTLIESQVLNHEYTEFDQLPLIFAAQSILIKDVGAASAQYVTLPSFYQAMDPQRVYNFALRTMATEVQNMVMHKFTGPIEGIPTQEEYVSALVDPQKSNFLAYHQFDPHDPQRELNPITPVPRVPCPPEVMQLVSTMPGIIQTIMGVMDIARTNQMGVISGDAIDAAERQASMTSMPYIVAFYQAINSLAQMYINLLPKYFYNAGHMDYTDDGGLKQSMRINDPDSKEGVELKYNVDAINIKVEPGVNTELQYQIARDQMAVLSKENPTFAGIMQTPVGISTLLQNCTFNGVEDLKRFLPQYFKMQQQQQQQASQMNPMVMKAQAEAQKVQQGQMKLQNEQQRDTMDMLMKQKELKIQEQDVTNDTLRIMMEANAAKEDRVVQMAKANVEQKVHDDKLDVEAHKHALSLRDQIHQHAHQTRVQDFSEKASQALAEQKEAPAEDLKEDIDENTTL